MARPRRLLIATAVRRDIAEIRKRDPALADSALAVMALALALRIDDRTTSASAASQLARALRETLERLRELAPTETAGDALDDLAARRERRRANAAVT